MLVEATSRWLAILVPPENVEYQFLLFARASTTFKSVQNLGCRRLGCRRYQGLTLSVQSAQTWSVYYV